jgi:hypothetical protein
MFIIGVMGSTSGGSMALAGSLRFALAARRPNWPLPVIAAASSDSASARDIEAYTVKFRCSSHARVTSQMAVPSDAEQTAVPNRFFHTIENEFTRMHGSPQYAQDRHDHKRGRAGTERFQVETLVDAGPERRLEQKFSRCGGVDDRSR